MLNDSTFSWSISHADLSEYYSVDDCFIPYEYNNLEDDITEKYYGKDSVTLYFVKANWEEAEKFYSGLSYDEIIDKIFIDKISPHIKINNSHLTFLESGTVNYYRNEELTGDSFGNDLIMKVPVIRSSNIISITQQYNKISGSANLAFAVLWEGDANGDAYTDAFDVAIASEYVNNFEEPPVAVKMSLDVCKDGFLDASDLAYIMMYANFEM